MTVPELGCHFHVGIVVADLHEARRRLSELLGVTWGPVVHLDEVSYRDPTGVDLVLPTTMCYSTGEPCLELIEEVPGSVWVRNQHSNLHHIGFWVEGLAATSQALSAIGCPLQLSGRDADAAPVTFTYHRDDDLGVRVELVDASLRDVMAALFRPDPSST